MHHELRRYDINASPWALRSLFCSQCSSSIMLKKIVRRRGGLLVQLSQFYHFRIRGWWRWMEMLCYGDVDGDQTEPYPGLAAATKWPHFAHLTQMTSNKYKHFPENLLHLQHSWQTHVNETQWFRKVPSKKSKPFEWGLGWEAIWANLSEPGFSRRGFPWNVYPLYMYFHMSCNILDPLFDKSEDLRHLEESWCCQGGCQGIRGVQCQSIWSVLQSLSGGFNTQVLMLVLVVKT